MKSAFIALTLCLLTLTQAHGQREPASRYGFTETNGLQVNITLGGDDIRGGGQLLLVIQLSDGRNRKFDLNRSREAWPGGAERSITLDVIPPIPLADMAQIGLEWHGSQGDFTQEQDDTDIQALAVNTFAPGAAARSRGQIIYLGSGGPIRLEDDQKALFIRANPEVAAHSLCSDDNQCSDNLFCNGIERCEPANPLADARGCMVGIAPCTGGGLCNESTQQCRAECEDRDGDGHQAAHCGGDDCDDNNPRRYPGNVEVQDAGGIDEDCNPATHGVFSGTPAYQVCDGAQGVVLVDAQENFTRLACGSGTVCIPQPNGTGICGVKPEGYQAPAASTLPTGQQRNTDPRLKLPGKIIKPVKSGN